MKKEQQNIKNSTENKNITSNDNSNSTPYQCKDNSSISGSKLKSEINSSWFENYHKIPIFLTY